jgi:hypothetical protein
MPVLCLGSPTISISEIGVATAMAVLGIPWRPLGAAGNRSSLSVFQPPQSGATPKPSQRLMAAGLAMKCRLRLHLYSLHLKVTDLKAS